MALLFDAFAYRFLHTLRYQITVDRSTEVCQYSDMEDTDNLAREFWCSVVLDCVKQGASCKDAAPYADSLVIEWRKRFEKGIRYSATGAIQHGFDAGVLAERERCARIAETWGVGPETNVFGGGPEWLRHANSIARKIRSGE